MKENIEKESIRQNPNSWIYIEKSEEIPLSSSKIENIRKERRKNCNNHLWEKSTQ